MIFLEWVGLNTFSFLPNHVVEKLDMMWVVTCLSGNKTALGIKNLDLTSVAPWAYGLLFPDPQKEKTGLKGFYKPVALHSIYFVIIIINIACNFISLLQNLGQEEVFALWQECGKVCLWIGRKWSCFLVPDFKGMSLFLALLHWVDKTRSCMPKQVIFL